MASGAGETIPTAADEEALEGCASSKSDSAFGSELVDDDVTAPLSASSLSDDDDDDDDGNNDSRSSFENSSPVKALPRSPSQTLCDADVRREFLATGSTTLCGTDTPSSLKRQPSSSSDANDNDLTADSGITTTTTSSSCCACGESPNPASDRVLSDSRDAEVHPDSRAGKEEKLHIRCRRQGPSNLPPDHLHRKQQQQHQQWQQQQHTSSLMNGSASRGNGDEGVAPDGLSPAASTTDFLADSCDDEDDDEARPVFGAEEKEESAKCEKSEKNLASDEDENARSSSFNKWDPSSWPSWFERFFANDGAAADSSFEDDGAAEPNGHCVQTSEEYPPARTPSLSKNEFNCSCCFELMVEPTTIQCGHSFCRVCLANWYFGSNSKRTCPQCRQCWNGSPQTNVILRSTIRTLFPSELAARESEAQEDVDAIKKLKRFDVAMSRSQSGIVASLTQHLWPRTGNGFVNGCIFSTSAFLVVYLAFVWRHSEAEMTTVTKPIVDWRVEDVASWLDSVGPWTKGYRDSFVDNAIDGQLVLALTDRDLQESPFGIKLHYHRRAFLAALAATRTHGAKPPTNLWEYKAANPGTALLLLWGLKSLPRHTILVYMLLFDYESILLPFVHITCPLVQNRLDNIPNEGHQRRLDPTFWELQPFRRKALFFQSLVSSKLGDDIAPSEALQAPSLAQWVEFITKAILLPHFLVAEVAWDWLNVHYWTVRFILMDCLFLSIVELFRLRLLCQRNFSQFFTPYSAVIQEVGLIVFVCVIWRFLPSILCDVVFYSLLYVFPFLRMLNFAFRIASFLLRS